MRRIATQLECTLKIGLVRVGLGVCAHAAALKISPKIQIYKTDIDRYPLICRNSLTS